MNRTRQSLLQELEQFGVDNDRRVTARAEKMLNITPETGAFLAILLKAMKARRVLEIGTSNGYSTIWLADAIEPQGGRVFTVDTLPAKADLARQNYARADLSKGIEQHVGDAGAFLRQASAPFDFIFLDADRSQYLTWWPDLQRVLAPGGLLVADNAVSHPQELEDFCRTVAATAGYTTVLVPIGKGEFLAHRAAGPA